MESSTSISRSPVALPTTGLVFSLGSLYSYLAQIADQRKRRGIRYPLATILVLVILAKLCGQTTRPTGGFSRAA